jgi:hypothetical protein
MKGTILPNIIATLISADPAKFLMAAAVINNFLLNAIFSYQTNLSGATSPCCSMAFRLRVMS